MNTVIRERQLHGKRHPAPYYYPKRIVTRGLNLNANERAENSSVKDSHGFAWLQPELRGLQVFFKTTQQISRGADGSPSPIP
jgi:hypothetical protein